MDSVRSNYKDRLKEIESYLELLMAIDEGIKHGDPTEPSISTGVYKYKITPIQQKVMYAGVYLHLYNLVESTVSHLLNAIEKSVEELHQGDVNVFNQNIRNLWIKGVVLGSKKRTNDDDKNADTGNDDENKQGSADSDARVKRAIELYQKIDGSLPFEMNIPRGGGGNWDNQSILKISDSIGVDVNSINKEVYQLVRRPIQDDLGPLRLVRSIRNKLAHGSISFAECAGEQSIEHFINIFNAVSKYLNEVIESYDKYILENKMLTQENN